MSIVNATMSDQIAELRAEIARLRAGIEEYACTGTNHPCGCHTLMTADKAEIERLQFESAMLRRAYMGHQEEIAELREEIERMKKFCTAGECERRELRAEIERLRAVLTEISDPLLFDVDGVGDERLVKALARTVRIAERALAVNQQIQKDEPK